MAIDISKIKTELVNDLKVELADEPTFTESVLEIKVKAVIRELISLRRYDKSGMTDAQIEDDLNNFYTQLLNVARYDFNTIGAEGEQSHSENGVTRKYSERNKLWNGVVAYGRW